MGIMRQEFAIPKPPEQIFIAVQSYRRLAIANAVSTVRSFRRILCLGLFIILSASFAHAQTFDPRRCPDRTQTGVFHCDISRPIVNKPEWTDQIVQFAPGDTVYIGGDGCVQTGGSGPTWKRYVNPSGANSDQLYHGLVLIPSARLAGTDVGNSLTRIRDVVGRAITVTGEGVPLSDLVLHAGYEDNDYSDNGYTNHDDGTEDQCKQDISPSYGGPAQLDILICRGVPCEPVGSRYNFDVLSIWTDPNGFLWNPHWSWQEKPGNHGQPASTSLCHQFSKHDVGRPYLSPNFPDCTDQSGIDRVDSRDGGDLVSAAIAAGVVAGAVGGPVLGNPTAALGVASQDFCKAYKIFGFAPNDSFAGHVNWFPVTVEGSVHWDAEGIDDDEEFTVHPCNESDYSLYANGGTNLHGEFDSDETVKHFGSQEWQQVEKAIGSGDNDNVRKYLEGYTIMTGMFGLDGEHELKSEIHPIYAMATRRDKFNFEDSPSDEVWLMFVRNLGDEGFCSSHIWSGGFTDYTFRLPWRAGMTSVTVESQLDFSDGTPRVAPTIRVVPPVSGIAAPLAPGVQQNVCNTPPPDVSAAVAAEQRIPNKTSPLPGQNTSGSAGAAPAVAGAQKSVLKGPPILGVNNPVGSAGANDPSRTVNVNAGVYVTFHLGPPILPPSGYGPASTPYIDGTLHLMWSGPPNITGPIGEPILKLPAIKAAPVTATAKTTPPVAAKTAPSLTAKTVAPVISKTAPPVIGKTVPPVIGVSAPPEEADDLELKIAAAVNRLSAQQKAQFLKALPNASLAAHPVSSGNPVQVLKSPTTGVTGIKIGAHQPVAGLSGVAVQKLVRDAGLVHALCTATNNAPSGLPPEICNPTPPATQK